MIFQTKYLDLHFGFCYTSFNYNMVRLPTASRTYAECRTKNSTHAPCIIIEKGRNRPYSRLHFRSVLFPPHGDYFPTSKIYRLLSVKFKFTCCNVHKPAVLQYNTAKILQNQHNRRHISLKLCQFLYEVLHFPLNKQSKNGSKCKHDARFHWAIFTYFSTIHVYF